MTSTAARRVGRKPVWTPERKAETFSRICQEISLGNSLRSICAKPDMPSVVSVREWINEDGELAKQYAHAREAQADFYADEIIEIADTETDPQRARVRIDARKWIASKMLPKVFGDKLTQELTGKDGAPLVPILNVTVGRGKS